MAPEELRQATMRRPDELLDSRFLFWLRDAERAPRTPPARRAALARLGEQLTAFREWTGG